MPGVKTAISLDEKLFNRVNKLAKKMHVSRSRLFTLAVDDYLKKQENEYLLAQLNKAYAETDDEEIKISNSMKSKQRKIVEQESW
jgi:metal-responsive CopG/Arc/MetJ family transcriptional regulator